MNLKDFKEYEEVDSYITALSSPGINPGLERVSALLDLLGNPEAKFPSVHVVGTNGKGSTSAMIDSSFRAAGYRSALYTSPHLVHFGERLLVNGEPVSSALWMDSLKKIGLVIDENEFFRDNRPTYFEILTVAAIFLMSKSSLDVAVVEAGMGGRLDATNRLSDVRLSVVTPIAMDHCEYLGDSIESVAGEKFAVVRPCGKAIFAGDGDGGLSDRFASLCDEIGAEWIVADKIYPIYSVYSDFSGTSFKINSPEGEVELRTSLLGLYQARNGRLAYGACKMLQGDFPKMTDRAIIQGLSDARWPGRLEVIDCSKGKVIIDGAHNPHGMAALVESLPGLIGNSDLGVVYTSMNDKDYGSVLELLSKMPCHLFCTSVPDNPRSATSEEILERVRSIDWPGPVEGCDDPEEALNKALDVYPLVLCCGSLYLVARISRILKHGPCLC